MSTDGSSNILTNFNISNGNYYDILSTIYILSTEDNMYSNGDYYFYLGQLLIQFGQVTNSSAYDYPIAYNQTPYAVCLTSISGSFTQCYLTSVSTSTFKVNTADVDMNYIVIGQIDNLSGGLDGSMNFSNFSKS